MDVAFPSMATPASGVVGASPVPPLTVTAVRRGTAPTKAKAARTAAAMRAKRFMSSPFQALRLSFHVLLGVDFLTPVTRFGLGASLLLMHLLKQASRSLGHAKIS